MTNEEAIEELKERYLGMSAYADREQFQKANQALDMAIEALEKQIPKKCETREGRKAYRCPLCGEWFIGSVDDMIYRGAEPNFCSLCGQALDWSDFK